MCYRFWQQRRLPTTDKSDYTPAYEWRIEICHVDLRCSGMTRGRQLCFAVVTPLTISTGTAQIEISSKWSLRQKEMAKQQAELPYLRCNDINTNRKILDNVASYLFCSWALPYCWYLNSRSKERSCIDIIANRPKADQTVNYIWRYCSYWGLDCIYGVSSDRGFKEQRV